MRVGSFYTWTEKTEFIWTCLGGTTQVKVICQTDGSIHIGNSPEDFFLTEIGGVWGLWGKLFGRSSFSITTPNQQISTAPGDT